MLMALLWIGLRMEMTPTTRGMGGLPERYPATRQSAAALRWILYLAVGCLVTTSPWTLAALCDTVGTLEWGSPFARWLPLLAAMTLIFRRDLAMERNMKGALVIRSCHNRDSKAVRP
jgi:hypothetical protein